MKGKFLFIFWVSLFSFVQLQAQTWITGRIINANNQKPVSNAHIILNKGKTGQISGANGTFRFFFKKKKGAFMVEHLGFKKQTVFFKANGDTTRLPDIQLQPEIYALNEINVKAEIITDKKTPVNVTTLSARAIESRIGDQPLPLIFNSIPGVFSVREGGGSGDARLSIRGFQQDNVALLLNGIPINGGENGLIYWSNWLGLSEAAANIQVQKGPGFSNLTSNAVGGSINIITRTNHRPKGGSITFQMTDYGNQKITLNLNSGKLSNGWNFSFLGSYYSGDGYVDATYVHGFSYFFSANKQINKRNHLNITLLGAPQHHGQRTQRLTNQEENEYGNKYNKDWGGLDGKILNASENFYHKPFLTITHDFKINATSKWSNTIFVTYGYGGGKWSEGFHYAPSIFTYRTPSGQIDWQTIYEQNATNQQKYVLANGDTVTGYSLHVLTDFLASHIHTGFTSTYEKQFSHKWKLTTGLYYSYLNSYLREKITDLMGGDFFIEDYAWSLSGVAGRNQIKHVGDIIKVDNNSIIHRLSAYSRLLFTDKSWQGYLAVNGNNQWYSRIDRFNYISNTKSPVVSRTGFDLRSGLSFTPFFQHNFYVNGAFISRVPYFKYVFGNFNNTPVQGLENEHIKTIETGYRYQNTAFKSSITLFYTRWENVSMLSNEYVQLSDNSQSRAMIHGLNSVHKGIEVSFRYKAGNNVTLGGMASFGDYRWQNDVSATLINDNNVVVDTVHVYARDLYVGGTAQQQLRAFADFKIGKTFSVHIDWNWYDKIFADFDPINRTDPTDRQQPYAFPAYQVVNASLSLPFRIGELPALFRLNGYNLFNQIHIETGQDGLQHDLDTFTGFWSYGIHFNLTLKIYL